jgi:hypothetical protein
MKFIRESIDFTPKKISDGLGVYWEVRKKSLKLIIYLRPLLVSYFEDSFRKEMWCTFIHEGLTMNNKCPRLTQDLSPASSLRSQMI